MCEYSERRLPGGRAVGFQPAARVDIDAGQRGRQDAGGPAAWKAAFRVRWQAGR